jgi:2-polyprenyl-3-methyl-5-hydroxy-6-metoxy-1,4-benzoquinol methylase
MPTVEWNLQQWNQEYKWTKQGDEWSATWGGAEAQWFGAILPRIHAFVPARTILEIAPGFGRWTNFLRGQCERLVVVDMAESCITACRERFASDSHISYHVNDGKSLEMIPDNSVDFVFSFDSLVHAEADVLEIYLRQLAKKLTPNGVGFIHHSNIGEYRDDFSRMKRIPSVLQPTMTKMGYVDPNHWRAFSMTARLFAQYCEQNGLACIGQELVNWGSTRMIDSFSLFTRIDSAVARPNRVIENPEFMKEAELIKRWAPVYTAPSFSQSV